MPEHLPIGEILASVMAGLFALAFGAWARRLDRALELLEKLQQQMHDEARKTERRMTRNEERIRYLFETMQLHHPHDGGGRIDTEERDR